MAQQTEEQEMAFLEALRKYENQWVAIIESGGSEMIVGSGKDAVQAQTDAEAKGFPDATLFKVPSFSVTLIP